MKKQETKNKPAKPNFLSARHIKEKTKELIKDYFSSKTKGVTRIVICMVVAKRKTPHKEFIVRHGTGLRTKQMEVLREAWDMSANFLIDAGQFDLAHQEYGKMYFTIPKFVRELWRKNKKANKLLEP